MLQVTIRMTCAVLDTSNLLETSDYFVWVPDQLQQQVERSGTILPTGEYDYVKLKRSAEDSLNREKQFGSENTVNLKAGLIYKITITKWGEMIFKDKGLWYSPQHLAGAARFYGALPLNSRTDTGISLTQCTEIISIS